VTQGRMLPTRGHLAGIIALLVVGWGAAIGVYLTATSEDPLPLELTQDAKLNVARLERLAGKSAVVYEQLNEALKSLWQGPNLGITLFVITSLVALVWFVLASPKSRANM
jgi:hypothetical protein